MKIVAMSDSHGYYGGVEKIYLAQRGADLFLHLGDGVADAEQLMLRHPQAKVAYLRGNCDYSSSVKKEALFDFGGLKIFAAHGHEYGVKYGEENIVRAAKALGADIAFFGHTHNPFCEKIDGLWLVNPGSVAFTNRMRLSFAIAEITDGAAYCYTTSIAR